MKKIEIAFITGSTKKFEEVQGVLKNVDLAQLRIDLPEIQEVNARTIIEAKLREASAHKPEGGFIIEDTSLYMEATPGLPGPLIIWFLETIGAQGLADIADKFENRNAVAKTIIGYVDAKQKIQFFEGEVRGSIVAPRADNGFGWDLVFVPEGYQKTFSEMTQEEKSAISMRGQAAQKLKDFLDGLS